jgi:hypothetical protein
MTHPKEDGFSVTHSEPVRQPLACQKCGGEIQGWTCQGCGQVFRENDAGALVFAPMEAVAWREKVARDCLFWRDGEEMKLSVKQAIAAGQGRRSWGEVGRGCGLPAPGRLPPLAWRARSVGRAGEDGRERMG